MNEWVLLSLFIKVLQYMYYSMNLIADTSNDSINIDRQTHRQNNEKWDKDKQLSRWTDTLDWGWATQTTLKYTTDLWTFQYIQTLTLFCTFHQVSTALFFQLPPVSSEKLASFKKYWFIFYMYTTVPGVYRSLRNYEMVMDFQILRLTWTYIRYVQETTTYQLEPKLQNNDEFRWRIHQNMG